LVVCTAGIGDLVLASRSMRAVRRGHPDAIIHLLTSTQAAPLAWGYDFLDHVWSFPIRELKKERLTILPILKLIQHLKRIRFDTILNLYRVRSWAGSLQMGLLFLLLRARIKAGHDHKAFGMFLNRRAPTHTFENRHIADAMMEVALLAGAKPDGGGTEVHWDRSCEERCADLVSKAREGGKKIIGINPGGDRRNRRWQPERYALVADRLAEEFNARIVLFGGRGEEGIAGQIQGTMRRDAINLAGKLDLNELACMLSRLDLLLTNDSGPMHIAAALKTPLVALFGPEDPKLFGPYTTPDLYRVLYKDVACRPCNMQDCKQPTCLDLITPEEVLGKCVEILNS
jgi:lipopolysaccharide heptosyltransferase II